MAGRRSKKRRDERYAAAVRRQIEYKQGPHARWYAPVEAVLRKGDTAEGVMPTATQTAR